MSRFRSALSVAVDLGCIALLLSMAYTMYVQHARAATARQPFYDLPRDSVTEHVFATDSSGVRDDVAAVAGGTNRPNLLLVFRSDCVACAAQKEQWLALAKSAHSRGVRVVGLTPEELTPTVRAYFAGSPVQVMHIVDPRTTFEHNLFTKVTPTTLVVGPGHKIEMHVAGVMTPDLLQQLRSLVGS